MFITSSLQLLFVGLAALMSLGSLVQDSKLNKVLEMATPLSGTSISLASNLDSINEAVSHTHIERPSAQQQFSGIPRIQVRDDHKRYVLPKSTSSKDGFFDSSVLWPSV